MSEPVYTIAQIRAYLRGGILCSSTGILCGDDPDGAKLPENVALLAVIAELDDPEDGIEAVCKRGETP